MSDHRFDVPFPMPAALSEEIRHGQMAFCLFRKLPKLWPVPIGEGTLSLACYGPSLKDTWQDLKHPIMSMSGSHNFLIERGVIPDYHVDMDPRPHKLSCIMKPHKDVQYLMASVCHPFTWSILEGYNVKTWHVISGKGTKAWIERYDPKTVLVAGGSSIGLASIHVGGLIGFRHFEIHGMDGSFKGEIRHAGQHFGHSHQEITQKAGGRYFRTSKIMMNSNVELINMLNHMPFFVVLHGEGLQQSMVLDANLPNAALDGTEKAKSVRSASVRINWPKQEKVA